MVRIGIVGLGFMGRTHYDAYAQMPGAQVVAISDGDPKRAAGDLSGTWGNVGDSKTDQLPMDKIKGFTDYRQLLALPEVDVVDFCTPTTTHVELVTAALRAGKHVLCEKPMARNAAQARAIAEAAAESDRFFMPAMCMRFWPEWEWLKTAVDGQRYGRVLSAVFRRVGSMPAGWFSNGALSGGALLDLHIHDTDFIYHLFGKPAGVFSRGYKGGSGEIDHVLTQYLYDGAGGPGAGPLVAAEGSWTASPGYGFTMRYTVHFEKATADFDLMRKPTLQLTADGKTESVETSTNTGYVNELAYLIECVRTNTRPTRVTAADGLAGILIADAEAESIRTGMPVPL